MFGRKFEVKVAMAPKTKTVETNSEEVVAVDYAEAVQETVRIVAANAIIGMVVFVGIDTLRQVIVKSTPGR